MSQRTVQSQLYEFKCDECGKDRVEETRPTSWSSLNVEGYSHSTGIFRKHFDLCAECSDLDKYRWARGS